MDITEAQQEKEIIICFFETHFEHDFLVSRYNEANQETNTRKTAAH